MGKTTLSTLGTLETYPSTEVLFVAFNTEDRLLSDERVRHALSMAVDRNHLLVEAMDGYGELTGGSLAPSHWAAADMPAPPTFDPREALRLLESAGWEDSDGDGWLDRQGTSLTLPVRTNGENPVRLRLATLVAADYRALGVRAEVEIVPWSIFADDLLSHDYHVAVFGWPLSLDPDQTSLWSSSENGVDVGLNITSLSDAEIDRLLVDARSAPGCAMVARSPLYGEFEAALARTRAADFLLTPFDGLLVSPDVHGIAVGTFGGPFSGAPDWFVTDAQR